MSDRESVLEGLGISLAGRDGASEPPAVTTAQDFPSLSGYSEFTPIKIVSTGVKATNANLESDKQRD